MRRRLSFWAICTDARARQREDYGFVHPEFLIIRERARWYGLMFLRVSGGFVLAINKAFDVGMRWAILYLFLGEAGGIKRTINARREFCYSCFFFAWLGDIWRSVYTSKK